MTTPAAAHRVTAIDAHAAGALFRLVTGGFPAPRGATMADKARWVQRHHEQLCRALVLEPRGHEGIVLGVLCEPLADGSDAGILFRHAGGFARVCGHGLIAAATIVLERGLIVPRDDCLLRLDTAAGTIVLQPERAGGDSSRVAAVRYTGPPAFVLAGGVTVTAGARAVRADIAHAGEFLAIVDSESAGVPLDRPHLDQLRSTAARIASAVEATAAIVHPADAGDCRLAATVFTGPPVAAGAHVRSVPVYADGTVDRSPSGTAVAAILAVLDAMGLDTSNPVVMESLTGTSFRGRVLNHVDVAGTGGVQVEVAGSAWIVAEQTFVIDPADPLRHGMPW